MKRHGRTGSNSFGKSCFDTRLVLTRLCFDAELPVRDSVKFEGIIAFV